MADVVTTIQSSIDIVGKLLTLNKKSEDANFKMLLANLSNKLADAKLEVAKLKISLAETAESNQKLTEQLTIKTNETPIVREGAYSFSGQEGLFCTACFDTKQQKVRITPLAGALRKFGKWECPSCGACLGAEL
jgi:hypothetical protein